MDYKSNVSQWILTAMMTAVIVVLALFPPIPLGIIPVPIVLQSLGVLLAGILLGPKYGTLSVGLFLLLVALGMPFLSGGRGGIAMFVGPTAGYLWGWLIAPLTIGYGERIFKTATRSWWWELLVVIIGGVLVIDIVGAIGLTFLTHLALGKALLASALFVPGDVIKTIIAVGLGRRLRKQLNWR